jgi:hypothetical protein
MNHLQFEGCFERVEVAVPLALGMPLQTVERRVAIIGRLLWNRLRYTQQPMSCDATTIASDRAVNVSAWQAWWERAEPTFRVKTREAELDLHVFPLISPVSIGGRPVR